MKLLRSCASFKLAVGAAIAVCSLVTALPAAAQIPGDDWIVFTRDGDVSGEGDIYAVAPDGCRLVQLTTDPSHDGGPHWSPERSQVVFWSTRDGGNYQIYVMNADGSNQHNISNSATCAHLGMNEATHGTRHYDIETLLPPYDSYPAWSPDGGLIAFRRSKGLALDRGSRRGTTGPPRLWVMDADGNDQRQVPSGLDASVFGWSGDGRILFISIATGITTSGR